MVPPGAKSSGEKAATKEKKMRKCPAKSMNNHNLIMLNSALWDNLKKFWEQSQGFKLVIIE